MEILYYLKKKIQTAFHLNPNLLGLTHACTHTHTCGGGDQFPFHAPKLDTKLKIRKKPNMININFANELVRSEGLTGSRQTRTRGGFGLDGQR